MKSAIYALLLVAPYLAFGQGTAADYRRSSEIREKRQNLAVDVPGPATWTEEGHRFWYSKSVKGGHQIVMVDADKGTKGPAFDHEKLARALSTAGGQHYTSLTLPLGEPPAGRGGAPEPEDGAPLDALRFIDEGKSITFGAEGWLWHCSLVEYVCRKTGEIPLGLSRRGGGGGRPPQDDSALSASPFESPYFFDDNAADGIALESPAPSPQPQGEERGGRNGTAGEEESRTSPDGQWDAFIRNYNLFFRAKGSTEAVLLSYDGSEGNYYTRRSIAWSPDSKKLVAYRTTPGYEREVHYIESSPTDQLQPKYMSRFYRKPGDRVDVAHPVLFDLAAKKEIEIDNSLFPNPYDLTRARWWKDSRAFTFEYNQRGHQVYRVIEVDAATGRARALITEESRTFVDYRPLNGNRTDTGKEFFAPVNDGREMIWASERDGWEHLYLYEGGSPPGPGLVKNQITKGPWVVRAVDKVDEEKRQIWFRASGMDPGKDPYFTHYYRINFDGTGLTAFTEADGDHTVTFSPDRQYYVDTWSRVDQPPVSELRRTADRGLVMPLEKADISALIAAGWKPPEVFVAKGRDGRTDIWGLIYRPGNFDASKKYPVIESIYAGPQGSFVPKTFTAVPQAQPLAELGFVVVQIDGMGTNNRSRAFHDVAWHNLADAGFPDRILWHKAVAARYPWYDISRVGIYGTSAGGQSALGALLFHPEFYKVAVSNSGCHDNRMDKIWWNEQWMGWPLGPQYAASSNVDNAYRLQGKVLLVAGEMDTNVDPSSTFQVVNQLIKHNKKFDLLYVPGGGHGAGGAYYQHLLQDFFVHNLLGVEPPDWNRSQ